LKLIDQEELLQSLTQLRKKRREDLLKRVKSVEQNKRGNKGKEDNNFKVEKVNVRDKEFEIDGREFLVNNHVSLNEISDNITRIIEDFNLEENKWVLEYLQATDN